jgi:maleamate amidohydrolase
MADEQTPFTGRLGYGDYPALVVVDMVRAYTEPRFSLYAGPHVADVVASIITLVEAARTAEIPVLFTGVRYEPGGADGGVFFRKLPPLELFVGDGDAGELVRGLHRRPDEPLLLKQYPSAFFGTSLTALLGEQGVDTVLLAGVSTSGCIRATATDAMQLGFVPIVVREAVGDRNPATHEANLFDIDAKIGDVVPLADALAHLAARRR